MVMDSERSEYELALRARGGDREALAELVERTRLRLFALAYGDLRHYEDAQDAVATALLQICRHVHSLREPERVCAWMRSIVRNEVRRLRRGADASLQRLEEPELRGVEAGPSVLRLDIERALRRLSGDEAQALRLYYLEELSTRDIADQVGRPEGTVRSWLHRGRRRLATAMEGYASMTPTENATPHAPEQSPIAALIHVDLDAALVRQVTDSLRGGGFETRVVHPGAAPSLAEAVRGCRAVLLDEGQAGPSAFEVLLHLRAHPNTKSLPVNVLCSDPTEFTVSAYFLAGVARLFRKHDAADLARIGGQLERDGFWQQFTERAREAVFAGKDEAARLEGNYVGSEHLLLGLIREPASVGCRLLTERLGISLDAVRAAVEEQTERGPGYQPGEEQWLRADGKRVIDLTFEEARRLQDGYIGTEHLLLGLLREQYGMGAQVLTGLGVELERVRQEVQEMRAG
jgi:RNA polymerase sigma factor (sigma-70 family)